MPPQYIFPCTNCDHKFELVNKQAGQQLTCPSCESSVEAPMLGKMKQLELVAGTEPTTSTRSSGGGWKNILFAAGLAMMILGGAAGFGMDRYSQSLQSGFDAKVDMEQFGNAVDNASAAQIVLLYQEMDVKKGLGDWFEPDYVRYDKQSAYLKIFTYVLYGIAGIGLLCTIGSFLMKR